MFTFRFFFLIRRRDFFINTLCETERMVNAVAQGQIHLRLSATGIRTLDCTSDNNKTSGLIIIIIILV